MNNNIDDIKKLKLPRNLITEISVLGKYQGEGESIVIHLQNDIWMIVDSFSYQGKAAAIYYLEERGFKDWNKVKYVVCSHWHKDHMQKIDDIIVKCKEATFIYMHSGPELIKKIIRDSILNPELSGITCSKAFVDAMDKAKHKQSVSCNQEIGLDKIKDNYIYNVRLSTISPSTDAVDQFCIAVADKNINEFLNLNKNRLSIGLLFQSFWWNILLSGDLAKEKSNCDNCIDNKTSAKYGWCNALNLCIPLRNLRKKIGYIKIAHHGSDTGYCEDLYRHYIAKKAIGVMTAFSTQIPTDEMIAKYAHEHKELYVLNNEIEGDGRQNGQNDNSQLMQIPHQNVQIDDKLGVAVSRKFLFAPWHTRCFGYFSEFYQKSSKIYAVERVWNMNLFNLMSKKVK